MPETRFQLPRPGALRVGLALFAVGLVFLVIVVLPFFAGDHNRSLWLNLGCMLAPLGFIVAVTSMWRASLARQRAVAAELGDHRRFNGAEAG